MPANSHTALLFTGALYADEAAYREALPMLEASFGPSIFESLPHPWHTEHYRDELGWPITRRFVFFRDHIAQDGLMEIKLRTISMERELSVDGRRRVNLDPGYLSPAKVVLASTKDYAHRIYLGKGIFAETTLYYQGGSFRGHLFTYPDFQGDDVLGLMGMMRTWARQ